MVGFPYHAILLEDHLPTFRFDDWSGHSRQQLRPETASWAAAGRSGEALDAELPTNRTSRPKHFGEEPPSTCDWEMSLFITFHNITSHNILWMSLIFHNQMCFPKNKTKWYEHHLALFPRLWMLLHQQVKTKWDGMSGPGLWVAIGTEVVDTSVVYDRWWQPIAHCGQNIHKLCR